MKMKTLLQRISIPVIKEFPLIVLLMLFCGMKGIIFRIFEQFRNGTSPGDISIGTYVSYLVIWFLFAYGIAFFVTHLHLKKGKWIIIAIAAVFFLVQDFLVHSFGSMISPQYLTLVAETTRNESSEFFSQFVFSSLSIKPLIRTFFLLGVFILLVFIWKRINIKRITDRRIVPLLSFPILLLLFWGIYDIVTISCQLSREKESFPEHLIPTDPVFRLVYSTIVLNHYSQNLEKAIRLNSRLAVPQPENQQDSLSIVLVIGESYSKWHTPLYGYYLNTTPFQVEQKEKGNLFVFEDVVSTSNGTSDAVRNLLCCNSIAEDEEWYESAFLPAIFKQNGYTTNFWDNQRDFASNNVFSFTLNGFIFSPEITEMSYSHVNAKSFAFDEDLILNYEESIREHAKKEFVVFHLMGQHFLPLQRYPHTPENEFFSSGDINKEAPYINDAKRQEIAEYDNATRYNDKVFKRITQLFQDRNSVIIYLSDHGDEIYDYRNQIYREQGPLTKEKLKYQYEIPFMIWCSEKYKNYHSQHLQAFYEAADKPFSSDHLSHLILGLAGIETPYYRKERDMLSPDYKCSKRVIDKIYDFDEIMHRN